METKQVLKITWQVIKEIVAWVATWDWAQWIVYPSLILMYGGLVFYLPFVIISGVTHELVAIFCYWWFFYWLYKKHVSIMASGNYG